VPIREEPEGNKSMGEEYNSYALFSSSPPPPPPSHNHNNKRQTKKSQGVYIRPVYRSGHLVIRNPDPATASDGEKKFVEMMRSGLKDLEVRLAVVEVEIEVVLMGVRRGGEDGVDGEGKGEEEGRNGEGEAGDKGMGQANGTGKGEGVGLGIRDV
ncbi:MAG: hypothetical protein Q9169_008613, partial [Polycauliona sp. 2 TL-2023]